MNEVTPSVERARKKYNVKEEIIAEAEILNVKNSVIKLKASPVLHALPGCSVVGAMYDIHTGKVEVIC